MGLRDLLALRSLQRAGMPLAPEAAILDDEAPFRLALASLLSLDKDSVNTYVARSHGDAGAIEGFVQVRERPQSHEATLVCIGPAPFRDEYGALWERLLSLVASWAGTRGILRLYAAVPAGSPEEGELRRCGYVRYDADVVYRLPTSAAGRPTPSPRLRPQLSRDMWALQRLYSAVTPLRVQQAEGSTQNGWRMPTGDWHGHPWTCSRVLEGREGLQAHLGLRQGGRSHHMRLVALPEARGYVPAILDEALSIMDRWPPRPVYCNVRQCQESVGAALMERGFEPLLSRSLTVRFSVMTVRPALEEVVLRLQNAVSTGLHSSVTENAGAGDCGASAQAAASLGSEWEYDTIPDYG